MCVSCAAESDHRGIFTFAALYRGYLEPYSFIAEEGYLPGGMKRRVLRYLYAGERVTPP